ncbi:protein ROS1A-like [Malania oleifera]|uniref:protein ROS1A-like n=1 Tax=Malania oleifera TaxID=397392 RepID=UPI0025AE939C|nr:protein ROS1A-like [Malania oleifera]
MHSKQALPGEQQGIKILNRHGTCEDALLVDNLEKKVTEKQNETVSPLVNAGSHSGMEDISVAAPSRGAVVLQMECIDSITQKLKCLDISDGGFQLQMQNLNGHCLESVYDTLVPYSGPYDPNKKRQLPAKVDLDEETMRVWRLLMGKDGSEDIEEGDEDKQKWWDEERKVFCGRVDSFIARMHLIQGNRRFSPWKGSVVDSVAGVFLTQNVSDHLSSSAFMSLAARFPLQSASNHRACNEDEKITHSNQESTGRNIGAVVTKYDLKDRQFVVFKIKKDTSHLSEETRKGNLITRVGRANLVQAEYNRIAEDAPSPKNPTGSSIVRTDIFELCSASNLKEDLNTRCEEVCKAEHSTEFMKLLQLEEAAFLQQFHSCKKELLSSDGTLGSEYTQRRGMSSPSFEIPLISSNSEVIKSTKMEDTVHISQNSGLVENPESEITDQEVPPVAQEATTVDLSASLAKSCMAPECSSIEARRRNYDSQEGTTVNLQSGKFTVEKPKTLVDGMIQPKNTIQPADEANNSVNKKNRFNETKTENSKGKKGKVAQKEENTIDWDSLRKSYSHCTQRERSANTIDSLDWEAVRCAQLEEVSKAILERGMNNVLAGRIQDFLNRIFKEHGSIDLEWLRDVPPEKAKAYLLSIRGLGLKSVECIQLLSLQHVAFPVDTNVGRIAVRLGWVPLRPLPEQLQIHLLDQYPLMDTIQKYLWPRLCRLDQRTLYELHYQMITFGKVFCTKRRPNCNACPMRGECKHFASAFASARLALPGPQERSSVSSMIPLTASENSDAVISHPLISLLDGNPFIASGFQTKTCEPIIEEPASPQPPCVDIPERDIEDYFSEDSKEIPTIKLNMEEFTANLQNYMMFQEDDTSKSLVALTSEAASIPMPKLKYVSRLRTEHQAYELPDSHPLLVGVDKREPDDPCPYLLAIWIPGEAANLSTEPNKRCDCQGSAESCYKKTCAQCNNSQEQNSITVQGTILMPCRTAMRGSFPLNGTYFQVNEVFADDESSHVPLTVPRAWIWNMPRRTAYFRTSTPAIFRGLSMEEIQYCFWKGFVCVRGFNRQTRAPRRLTSRFQLAASRAGKAKREPGDE